LANALDAGKYVTPQSISGTKFHQEYTTLTKMAINFVKKHIDNPDSLGVLPHSLIVYDLIHINGWNAVYSIGKRTCTKAQWEIRGISKQIADYIKIENLELGKYAVPQGITFGRCPERNSCGLCFKK